MCPPICDAIPDSAWIAPPPCRSYPVYRWPGLAGLAVTAHAPRFTFEEVCATPPTLGDARDYAVAAGATVTNPAGQWQLAGADHPLARRHRAGRPDGVETSSSWPGPSCVTARSPRRWPRPSITTSDPQRLAAVISVAGQRVMHQYVLADPASSTVVDLAMWSTLPPLVPWPAVPDAQVLDAMAAPLCDAYLGSCR